MAEEISVQSQELHTKLFNQLIDKVEFEGIFLSGTFEEPALVLGVDRLPDRRGLNILSNTIDFKEDGEISVYFYLNNQAVKFGRISKDVDSIFLLEELLSRYKLEMIFVDNGEKKKVKSEDFIVYMKL